MPPRLRRNALRGFQGPAFCAGDAVRAALTLRGPPGDLAERTNPTHPQMPSKEVIASGRPGSSRSGRVIRFGRNG